MVIDCEPEEMMKWSKDYGGVVNAKVIPVMTREEWEKSKTYLTFFKHY